MRSAVEKQLNLIAHGTADYRSVLKHALDIFRLKFQYFVTNIANMDSLFEVSFSSLADSGKSHSRCGKCRRYMKYIQQKPARLHCSHCDETYSLPIGGIVRVYRELKCPLDDFELLSWSNGNKGRSYPFCPYCFNNAPFKDMTRGSGCNNCTHPTCQHSLSNLGVSSCMECEKGVLVLDWWVKKNFKKNNKFNFHFHSTSSPKNRIGCNSCDCIINCFDDAIKVSVDEDTCSFCGSQLVTVTYKQDKTPFADGDDKKTGCIFCCNEFMPLIEKHKAVENRRLNQSRGKSSRGRGRGRHRAHRGRPKDKMSQLMAYFV